ncbi:hypothetical protein HGM15179_015339 [Zosterops borbonicus]|uniref:Uncharacterized protein n=1 Tax=Zosterops borbonicus TaxID=364589 RepID=A0A8K1G4N2_9PASS|nr:hypothetical protein HGM15179_015339 [Zosterops borbonicus]
MWLEKEPIQRQPSTFLGQTPCIGSWRIAQHKLWVEKQAWTVDQRQIQYRGSRPPKPLCESSMIVNLNRKRETQPQSKEDLGVKRHLSEAQVMYLHMALSDYMAMSTVIIKHQFILSVLEVEKKPSSIPLNC